MWFRIQVSSVYCNWVIVSFKSFLICRLLLLFFPSSIFVEEPWLFILFATSGLCCLYPMVSFDMVICPLYLLNAAAAAAKSLQLCLTLCDPIDGNPPGSPIPGILQARTLQWVAISFSNAWKWKVKVKSLSRVRLLATPWTAAHQAPPSMGFSGHSTGMGCHCLLPYLFSNTFNSAE